MAISPSSRPIQREGAASIGPSLTKTSIAYAVPPRQYFFRDWLNAVILNLEETARSRKFSTNGANRRHAPGGSPFTTLRSRAAPSVGPAMPTSMIGCCRPARPFSPPRLARNPGELVVRRDSISRSSTRTGSRSSKACSPHPITLLSLGSAWRSVLLSPASPTFRSRRCAG